MILKKKIRKSVYSLIDQERNRQDEKWSHRKNNSTPEWMMILGEEYGEACQAGCDILFDHKNNRDLFIEEIVQVAAVAVAILENELGKKSEKLV